MKPDIDEDGLLRPVGGPSESQLDAGRRLLLRRLREGQGRRPRLLSRPATLIAGGLAFAAISAGAAASSDTGLNGSVSSLLDGLGVPGVSQDHDKVPSHGDALDDTSPGRQDRSKDTGAIPQPAAGETHGGAVAGAVADAIEGSDPGPERGAAVRNEACENARDRDSLPEQARERGPPGETQPAPCPSDEQSGGPEAQHPAGAPGQGQGAGKTQNVPDAPSGSATPSGGHDGGPPATPGPPSNPGRR